MGNYVITIARGFGSGGKEIGIKLAERLGIPCYEKEIAAMAAEYSGLNQKLFWETDEKLRGSLFLKKLKGKPSTIMVEPSYKDFESDINLFNIQTEMLRELVKTTSFVVIGKCADYVFRDYKNVASFYIEAPRAACVKSIVKKMGVSEEEAHRMIKKTDKYRADYYNYYTGGNYWTNPVNYDMTLNSDRVGREYCVDVMENYVKSKFHLD